MGRRRTAPSRSHKKKKNSRKRTAGKHEKSGAPCSGSPDDEQPPALLGLDNTQWYTPTDGRVGASAHEHFHRTRPTENKTASTKTTTAVAERFFTRLEDNVIDHVREQETDVKAWKTLNKFHDADCSGALDALTVVKADSSSSSDSDSSSSSESGTDDDGGGGSGTRSPHSSSSSSSESRTDDDDDGGGGSGARSPPRQRRRTTADIDRGCRTLNGRLAGGVCLICQSTGHYNGRCDKRDHPPWFYKDRGTYYNYNAMTRRFSVKTSTSATCAAAQPGPTAAAVTEATAEWLAKTFI